MDLDNYKQQWKSMQAPASIEKDLEETKLKKIIARKYNSMFISFFIPQLLLAGLYLFLSLFLVVFFEFFESRWLQFLAVCSIILLILIPVLRLGLSYRYYQSGKLTVSVGDVLANVREKGQYFLKAQYVLFALDLLLLINLIMLIPLVYSEELSSQQQWMSILVGALFLLFLSRLVWQHYKKKIDQIGAFSEDLF
jgi:hypothetical protein